MYFELWASGGPAWAVVPGSSGLARHETGPQAVLGPLVEPVGWHGTARLDIGPG